MVIKQVLLVDLSVNLMYESNFRIQGRLANTLYIYYFYKGFLLTVYINMLCFLV